jgi:hypothetical protein
LGNNTIEKNQLISTLDKIIYFKGTIFQGYTKQGGNQLKKIIPFSDMLLLAPRISLVWNPSSVQGCQIVLGV